MQHRLIQEIWPASYLAEKEGLNILLVDADPQCNATQLVLPDETTERLYESGTGLTRLTPSSKFSYPCSRETHH